jgi:hypothetical protein
LTHQVFQKHVAIDGEGDLSEVLKQEVVEVILFYFAPLLKNEEKDEINSRIREMVSGKKEACADVRAVRFGWSVENDFPLLSDEGKQDKTGAVLALFVGWSSIEAQKGSLKIDGDERFADSIGKDLGVVHSVGRLVQCRRFGEGNLASKAV